MTRRPSTPPRTRIPARTGPVRSKTRTIGQILDAARFLYANVGYFSIGFGAVADRAGVTLNTVRRYFPDKPALWREAMLCAPPDPRVAEEIALAAVWCPDQPVQIYAHGVRCRASIGNPARALTVPAAAAFSGEGPTPAEALRQARISADRFGHERAA